MQIPKGDYDHQGPDNQVAWAELRRAKNLFCRSDYSLSIAHGRDFGKKAEFDWCKDREKASENGV